VAPAYLVGEQNGHVHCVNSHFARVDRFLVTAEPASPALIAAGTRPVPCFRKVATLKPDLECRRDMKRHLLQDRIIAGEGRIDHGKIPLVREIEEIQ
jgi:hypothetical protein